MKITICSDSVILTICKNMASSDPEIRDGLTIPVWMKTKPTKLLFGFTLRKNEHLTKPAADCMYTSGRPSMDIWGFRVRNGPFIEFEPFAASPPAPEDSFFYIRYPKPDVLFGKHKGDQTLPRVLTEQSKEVTATAVYNAVKEKDWSKHTKPCQDVLHGIAPINTAASTSSKPKPAGTDDGFKGEGAACGNSVVKVAHQMISSSNRSPRGFTVASPTEDAVAPEPHQYNLYSRRGSKSLPATPAHSPTASPTSRRKMTGNRFFTSPFEPVEDASHRSWLSMALLGYKRDLATSTSTLAEEDSIETRLQGSLAESVENLGPAPRNKEPAYVSHEATTQHTKQAKSSQAYRAKPTELREMNFWSPTSM